MKPRRCGPKGAKSGGSKHRHIDSKTSSPSSPCRYGLHPHNPKITGIPSCHEDLCVLRTGDSLGAVRLLLAAARGEVATEALVAAVQGGKPVSLEVLSKLFGLFQGPPREGQVGAAHHMPHHELREKELSKAF